MSALPAVRAGYGLVELTIASRPAGVLPGDRRGPPGRLVAQVAGARYLAQAILVGPAPTAAVLALGVEVDLLHAASMIGLAIANRRHRRAGLTDAAAAACFATALPQRRGAARPLGRCAGPARGSRPGTAGSASARARRPGKKGRS